MHKQFYTEIIILYLGISLFIFSMYQFAHRIFGYHGYLYLIVFGVYTLVNIIILIGYTKQIRESN